MRKTEKLIPTRFKKIGRRPGSNHRPSETVHLALRKTPKLQITQNPYKLLI